MKIRTSKQKAATKRNHMIMRLKGIMYHNGIDFFTKEESEAIKDICIKVCIRHGISIDRAIGDYEEEINLFSQNGNK